MAALAVVEFLFSSVNSRNVGYDCSKRFAIAFNSLFIEVSLGSYLVDELSDRDVTFFLNELGPEFSSEN